MVKLPAAPPVSGRNGWVCVEWWKTTHHSTSSEGSELPLTSRAVTRTVTASPPANVASGVGSWIATTGGEADGLSASEQAAIVPSATANPKRKRRVRDGR